MYWCVVALWRGKVVGIAICCDLGSLLWAVEVFGVICP